MLRKARDYLDSVLKNYFTLQRLLKVEPETDQNTLSHSGIAKVQDRKGSDLCFAEWLQLGALRLTKRESDLGGFIKLIFMELAF